MRPLAQMNRPILLVAVAAVATAGHWFAADLHTHRIEGLTQERSARLAAVATLRNVARHARHQVRECRARRVAANDWQRRLPADRQALGRHVVKMLGSSAVRIVALRAASGADAGEAPAVLVRWRGSYKATLAALAALGTGALTLRFETLRLQRLDSADEPVEAEGIVVGGWLPPVSGAA